MHLLLVTPLITSLLTHIMWDGVKFRLKVRPLLPQVSLPGPFASSSRSTSTNEDGDEIDDEVIFVGNESYWAGTLSVETRRKV